MATYPTGKPGVAPPDLTTKVGIFRTLVLDTQFTEYTPPEPGIGNYVEFSDAEIEAYLATSGGSPLRAAGFAILGLALIAAKESKTVKDYDLQVDLSKKSADLRATANQFLQRADAEDKANSDIFELFDTDSDSGEFVPEASPAIWGREYGAGVWRRGL